MSEMLSFLGIYVADIDHATDNLDEVLKNNGFSITEIDNMYNRAKYAINECISRIDNPLDNITDLIIRSCYEAAVDMFEKRFPDKTVYYWVNGYCSSFEVSTESGE